MIPSIVCEEHYGLERFTIDSVSICVCIKLIQQFKEVNIEADLATQYIKLVKMKYQIKLKICRSTSYENSNIQMFPMIHNVKRVVNQQ